MVSDTSIKSQITIPLTGENLCLDISEVSYLEGHSNYTYIHVKKRKILSARTLRFYQDQVNDHLFIRIHKSFCINIDHIQSINFRARLILLKSGAEIPFARSKKKYLKDLFNIGHHDCTSFQPPSRSLILHNLL